MTGNKKARRDAGLFDACDVRSIRRPVGQP
jgi:hypothetical protein